MDTKLHITTFWIRVLWRDGLLFERKICFDTLKLALFKTTSKIARAMHVSTEQNKIRNKHG
jgi:hypothetical protein